MKKKKADCNNIKGTVYYDLSMRLVKVINLIIMTIPFVFAWYLFYADQLWVTFYKRGHWLVFFMFMVLYYLIGKIYESFKVSYHSRGEMIYSQVLACLEVDTIMYIVAWLLIRHLPNPGPMLCVLAVQLVLAVMWSFLSQAWYFHIFPPDRTIVVYDNRYDTSELIDKFNLIRKYEVILTITVDECIHSIEVLDEADTVFLSGIHSHDRNIIVKYCLMNNIKAFLIPRVGDLIVASARRNHMFSLLMLRVERFSLPIEYIVIKRIGDVVLSLVGLVILSPIILITALCIKMEDKGPIIYRQQRLTIDGELFDILKFRSMREDAEKDGVARLSTGSNDDRITRVGRLIRKVRIDEIPQLVNILKGDMSIVGPRAERPEIAAQYEMALPEFALRLQVKAGLTGYAQVYGKYNTPPYDKLLMDLMYIANASIFEDIRIIFATIKILFMPRSTEGVSEVSGSTTTVSDKMATDVNDEDNNEPAKEV